MYRVYNPAKPQVFISRNVRFASPLVGEDKEESTNDSNTDDDYTSDLNTISTLATEEDEEE